MSVGHVVLRQESHRMSSSNTARSSAGKLNSRLTAIFLIVLIDVLGVTIILPLLPF